MGILFAGTTGWANVAFGEVFSFVIALINLGNRHVALILLNRQLLFLFAKPVPSESFQGSMSQVAVLQFIRKRGFIQAN